VLTRPIIVPFLSWASVLLTLAGIELAGEEGERAWLLLAVLFVVLFFAVAPYKVWKSEKERADKAEEVYEPGLETQPDLFLHINPGGRPPPNKRTAFVRVTNTGVGTVRNCSGHLHGVYEVVGGNRSRVDEIAGANLEWSRRQGGGPDRPFLDLPISADLQVAEIEELGNDISIVILGVGGGQVLRRGGVDSRNYIFDIEVRQDGRAGVHKEYCLEVEVRPTIPPPGGQGYERSDNRYRFHLNDGADHPM
jgi:hypothetical protein